MTKRKKKLKKGPLLIIILFFIVGLYLILYNGLNIFTEKEKNHNHSIISPYNNNTNNNSNSNSNSKNDDKRAYKISLLATGDGLVHNAIYKSYVKEDGTYDFKDALSEVKDIVSKYDIAYYNQETPFGGKGVIPCKGDSSGYCGYPRFNTPSEYGDAMIDAGFNMISLASNHSLDSGEKGILNSVEYWKSKSDILYNGMAQSNEDRNNIVIKEKNNITYTMLSYTEMTNGLSIPSGKNYLINIYNKEQVKKDIESVRDKVDILIVAMHWGIEYQNSPNDTQKEIAQYLADLGVDIIIGNHPHVLQPITWIDDTLVIYSLGNFISNQYSSDDYNKRVGFLATLDINKMVDGDAIKITIDNLGGELIFSHYNTLTKEPNNRGHKVIPFSKMKDDTYLKDYERIYTKYSKILTSMGTELNITPLPN